MKAQHFFALLLLATVTAFAGCKKAVNDTEVAVGPSEPTRAQPRLDTVKVWLGSEEMIAEMAATSDQIRTGMMFRTNMAENEGMIFNLYVPQRAGFWMKNCFVPLSVAYIGSDGAILEIHDMQPQNTNSVSSAATNVCYALETPQGWFTRHNVPVGTVVRTERGSLQETFFGNRQRR